MAVSKTIRPVISPIRQDDERYPIGIWSARSTQTGDVSGGQNVITCQINQSVEELISTEQCWGEVAAPAAARDVRVSFVFGEVTNEGVVFDCSVVLPATLVVTTSAVQGGSVIGLPRYIALPNAGAYQVSGVVSNVNLEVFTFTIWGYIWAVKARLQLGGPIRLPLF